MWEDSFNNFAPQRSDLTCLDNVIYQPPERCTEHKCCREQCPEPQRWGFSNHTGVSRAADTCVVLPGREHIKRAHTRSTHCGPTSPQTGQPEQERLYKSKNMKGGLLAEEARSCTSLWALWITLPQLGSHS